MSGMDEMGGWIEGAHRRGRRCVKWIGWRGQWMGGWN